jgi:spore germination cell wall hydrolase CwlJ-like protein
MASPFGTIHMATFSFPQPVGTGIPASPGFHMAAYEVSGDTALTASLPAPPPYPPPFVGEEGAPPEFPEIDRRLKGPRLARWVQSDFYSQPPSTIEGSRPSSARQPAEPPALTAAAPDEAAPNRSTPTSANPAPNNGDFKSLDPETAEAWLGDGEDAPVRTARIYFETASLGGPPATLEPWGPGRTPLVEPPEPPPDPPPHPLPIPPPQAREGALSASDTPAPLEPPRNETIAPKGEVTGEEHRPQSPAERLGLVGAARARHEKCLADAIYFEARGESVRGQMAVAQVVINRVFSGYYPNNICGVVYQNAHRRFRCQFTFACDGLPERINEPVAWERAKHIARDALDGNFWLNDVGKATHYHARWVHPWWVHEMRRLDRIGVHTFYRPRNWGDGSKSPTWGDADATGAAAKTL